jgi:RNA polymerase sigma-70 factor (ECF subfamily)
MKKLLKRKIANSGFVSKASETEYVTATDSSDQRHIRNSVSTPLWQHRSALLAFGFRLTGSISDAEDLVQDVFTLAIAAKDKFDGKNLGGWLSTILFNRFVNRYKYGKIRRQLNDMACLYMINRWMGQHSLDPTEEQDYAAREAQASEVRHAVEALPDHYRNAIQLVDIEESSYQDAAARMDVPLGTVMSRLHRGRALLAQKLVPQPKTIGEIIEQ